MRPNRSAQKQNESAAPLWQKFQSAPPRRGRLAGVCGGTPSTGPGSWRNVGLSPRVRGNRSGCSSSHRWHGSIPACAGEPHRRSSLRDGPRVYPRVCGGTKVLKAGTLRIEGLSPRVRGNQVQIMNLFVEHGSIPERRLACSVGGSPIRVEVRAPELELYLCRRRSR